MKTIQKTIYEATDGTLHISEQQCKDHESNLMAHSLVKLMCKLDGFDMSLYNKPISLYDHMAYTRSTFADMALLISANKEAFIECLTK